MEILQNKRCPRAYSFTCWGMSPIDENLDPNFSRAFSCSDILARTTHLGQCVIAQEKTLEKAQGTEERPEVDQGLRILESACQKLGYPRELIGVMKESLQGIQFYRELGEGSLSLVYLVTLPGQSKQVVLKLCKYQTTPDYRSTWYSDKRHGGEMLGINFRHPNVMKTLGVITLNSKRQIEWIKNPAEKQTEKGMVLSIVQEYVSGGKELFDCIAEGKIQTAKQIHYIANSIACALYYLHKECNIAHRDIKPENVLIGKNGEVKVIDFSFLVKRERTKSQCGSPAYLAPEIVVADENAYDPKLADTFSFATLLFLIRFGESPWFTLEMDDMAAHLDLLLSFYHHSGNLAKYIPKDSKPDDELDGHLFDLIGKLGTGKPEDRLSLVEAIEKHPYFASLWKKPDEN